MANVLKESFSPESPTEPRTQGREELTTVGCCKYLDRNVNPHACINELDDQVPWGDLLQAKDSTQKDHPAARSSWKGVFRYEGVGVRNVIDATVNRELGSHLILDIQIVNPDAS